MDATMNNKQQARFVKRLCGSISLDIISKIESGKVPENWNGRELRQLLAEKFASETVLDNNKYGYGKNSKSFKAYENDIITNNL